MIEGEALERERRTALLPSVMARRPPSPLRAVSQPLLEIGPWSGGDRLRVHADGREHWLVHQGTLINDRLQERAVDQFEIRSSADGPALTRLVRKSVWDSPNAPVLGLADEGLFYGGLAWELAGRKFRLPRLHAWASSERGVSLVLEHVAAPPGHQDWATALRMAEALGEFGAKSSASHLRDSPLIKPLGSGFQPATADNLARMAEFCLPDGEEPEIFFDAFFAVFGDPNLLDRIHQRLCPCICHHDAFRRNMLTPHGEDAIVIIDWGTVRNGFIGHDASLMLIPGSISSRRLRQVASFDEAAGRVVEALWKGVDEADAGIGIGSVQLGLDFALLRGIARFADHHAGSLARTQQNAGAEELQARRQWLASALEFGRRKAEELARRFG